MAPGGGLDGLTCEVVLSPAFPLNPKFELELVKAFPEFPNAEDPGALPNGLGLLSSVANGDFADAEENGEENAPPAMDCWSCSGAELPKALEPLDAKAAKPPVGGAIV
jgi:hypothetical protein